MDLVVLYATASRERVEALISCPTRAAGRSSHKAKRVLLRFLLARATVAAVAGIASAGRFGTLAAAGTATRTLGLTPALGRRRSTHAGPVLRAAAQCDSEHAPTETARGNDPQHRIRIRACGFPHLITSDCKLRCYAVVTTQSDVSISSVFLPAINKPAMNRSISSATHEKPERPGDFKWKTRRHKTGK